MEPNSPVTPYCVSSCPEDDEYEIDRRSEALREVLLSSEEEEVNERIFEEFAQDEEKMPGHRALIGLYAVQVVASFDNALVLPSLYAFVESLAKSESNAKWLYGVSQTVYFGARVFGQLALGRYLDCSHHQERIFRRTLSIGLMLGVIGSLVYVFSIVGGVFFILIARSILGAASSVTVASLSFVSRHIPKSSRTQLFARLMGFQRASTPLAPLIVLACDKAHGKYLNAYTLPAVLTGTFNLIALCVILLFFDEPSSANAHIDMRPVTNKPIKKDSTLQILNSTGAWVSYVLSFQNNWNNQVVVWTLPLTTSALYGPDPVRDAFIFASGGIVGVIAAFSLSVQRKHKISDSNRSDRSTIVAAQCGVGVFLVGFTLAHSNLVHTLPLYITWLWFAFYYGPFIAQMPSNNALYSKLVSKRGSHSIGLLQSILEVSKSSARAFAGLAIGKAYATTGPFFLWIGTLALWCAQFIPLFLLWHKLNPLNFEDNSRSQSTTRQNAHFQYAPLRDDYASNSPPPSPLSREEAVLNPILELQQAQTTVTPHQYSTSNYYANDHPQQFNDELDLMSRVRLDAPVSPFVRVDQGQY